MLTTTTDAVLPTAISTVQDLDELKKQALIVAENKKLREENEGLKQERDALKGQRDSALDLATTWKTISTEWQEAATQRKGALATSTVIDTRLQADLDKTDAELARTRTLLDQCRNPGFLRSIFKTDTLFKFGAGVAVGAALNR